VAAVAEKTGGQPIEIWFGDEARIGQKNICGRPDGKRFFGDSNDLVGSGHMSGLLVRSICPLALMKSDDQDPYQDDEL
jgi:hypothetical protein